MSEAELPAGLAARRSRTPAPPSRLSGPARALGAGAAAGMLVVLVMGVTVTSTGSAQGCGRDWPLCNGRLVPDADLAALIEFSHRAVTAAESLVLLAFAAVLIWAWWSVTAVRVLGVAMVASLVAQAGMGAWAVKYPQAPAVLALHFGLSLIALASTSLGALWVLQRTAGGLPAVRAEAGLRWAALCNAAFLYLLVYSGAFIRHTGAAADCASWPLCGAGGAPFQAAVDLVHRGGAAVATLACLALTLACWRRGRPDLLACALALLAALAGQAAAGAYLVASDFSLRSELLHAALTGVAFTAACALCLQTQLGSRRTAPAAVPA